MKKQYTIRSMFSCMILIHYFFHAANEYWITTEYAKKVKITTESGIIRLKKKKNKNITTNIKGIKTNLKYSLTHEKKKEIV